MLSETWRRWCSRTGDTDSQHITVPWHSLGRVPRSLLCFQNQNVRMVLGGPWSQHQPRHTTLFNQGHHCVDLSRSIEPSNESPHDSESTYHRTSISLTDSPVLGTLPVGSKEAVISPKVGSQVGQTARHLPAHSKPLFSTR